MEQEKSSDVNSENGSDSLNEIDTESKKISAIYTGLLWKYQ